jgi:hypothetical protein
MGKEKDTEREMTEICCMCIFKDSIMKPTKCCIKWVVAEGNNGNIMERATCSKHIAQMYRITIVNLHILTNSKYNKTIKNHLWSKG